MDIESGSLQPTKFLRKKKRLLPWTKSSVKSKAKEISIDEHTLPIQKVLERYSSSLHHGLSEEEASSRLLKNGLNCLSPPKIESLLVKLLKIFFTGFSLLLVVGSLASFIGYAIMPKDPSNLYIGVALAVVVLVSGLFTFYNEKRSGDIMNSFKKLLPKQAQVLRTSKWKTINAVDLVTGDICMIEKGNSVPADLRIVEATAVKVDNSSLTGESEPQSRSCEKSSDNPLETKNLLFSGTSVVEGRCVGIVIRTGDSTTIGNIAKLVNETEENETNMSKEMKYFMRNITIIAVVWALLFFILSMTVQKQDFIPSLILFIGIVVANIPEGILATITVALTITAKRMAGKNALVKDLAAVETLGSTSVICTDKTGTLTMNQMTVVNLFVDGAITPVSNGIVHERMVSIASLCNKAYLKENGELVGDASEAALFKYAQSALNVAEDRKKYPIMSEIPFNSTNKYQVSIHAQPDINIDSYLLVMKGAPERIIQRCSTVLINGKQEKMSAFWEQKFNDAYELLGSQGQRVLGCCERYIEKSRGFDLEKDSSLLENLCFVGLFALMDPPKALVKESVIRCQEAGIKVIMVTGDHPITAQAIAKQVSIITHKTSCEIAKDLGVSENTLTSEDAKAIVIHGSEISHFDASDWKRVLKFEQIVFARTSPQQKYQIVEQNQLLGHIVAVTGDGVNDSPALKKADIGISMGISGSDVSRDASNMILLDDNFSTIVEGIREGRIIFDNLKKSIAYTLSSNIPELVPFITMVLFQIPLPLSTILILCIDLGTDMYPAISLAHEPAEHDIMHRNPRNCRSDRLVNYRLIGFSYLQIGVIQAISALFAFFFVMQSEGFSPSDLYNSFEKYYNKDLVFHGRSYKERMDILGMAQTAYFIAIVVTQWADLIICKTRKVSIFQHGLFKYFIFFILSNKTLWAGLFFETALALFITYVPGMDVVLGTRPLSALYLALGLPFAILIFIYDEARKWLIRKYPKGITKRLTYY